MAANNPVFTIRGYVSDNYTVIIIFLSPFRTCFYALCLIAKTKRGVEQLKQLGWVSVCHSHEHKWPVVHRKNYSNDVISQRSIIRERSPVQHQVSLPAVVLTSDTSDLSTARRRALLKKATSTMSGATVNALHHQKIIEDKVSEHVSEDYHVQAANSSVMDHPPKMRGSNTSSQQRPVSMMSLSSR